MLIDECCWTFGKVSADILLCSIFMNKKTFLKTMSQIKLKNTQKNIVAFIKIIPKFLNNGWTIWIYSDFQRYFQWLEFPFHFWIKNGYKSIVSKIEEVTFSLFSSSSNQVINLHTVNWDRPHKLYIEPVPSDL